MSVTEMSITQQHTYFTRGETPWFSSNSCQTTAIATPTSSS